MNGVNKTLYIPLYGKAYVSCRGIILRDPDAERIWEAEGFPLKGKSRSKWLAYYMGIRAAVFDRWVSEQTADVVLHLGCGMDSRVNRVGDSGGIWYDVDFPEVIRERRRYFAENDRYKMLGTDLRERGWLEEIPGGTATVVMEGISMYLSPGELEGLLAALVSHFDRVRLLVDCYTTLAAKASRVRNPINDVGVTQVYGLDDPMIPEKSGIHFLGEREMIPQDLIAELKGMEKTVFSRLYAGSISKKLYRLYEYEA